MHDLGKVGLWSRWFRVADRDERMAGCARMEALGYGAIWMPGMAGGDDLFDALELVLSSTRSIVVGAGILNIFGHEPEDVVRFCDRVHARHPGRFLLGLGVSHAKLMGERYKTPLASMSAYLDQLDRHESTAKDKRCLAALGPKMVAIARERSLGVHSYNVSVPHTRETRERLGAGPLLAPELTVAVEEDRAKAYALARTYLARYLDRYENYTNNLRRLGFGDADFESGGSDRLIEALVACGAPAVVGAKIREHLAAGADHVCLQILSGPEADPRAGAERLAEVVKGIKTG